MSEPLDDLRAVLGSIEPSPAFESRTLARIDRERAAAPRRAWIFLAPVAAAAAVVIAAISLRPSADVKPVEPAGVEAAAKAISRAPIVAPASQPAGVMPIKQQSRRRAAVARPVSVEVAIPKGAHADQVMGLRRVMALIRAGKLNVPGDSMVLDDSGPVPVLAPVELKPILIAPLSNGQGGGSER